VRGIFINCIGPSKILHIIIFIVIVDSVLGIWYPNPNPICLGVLIVGATRFNSPFQIFILDESAADGGNVSAGCQDIMNALACGLLVA
jgi:hypothetical protein